MSTGNWLIDTFGKASTWVVFGSCLAFVTVHWVFIRPRMLAWVQRDPSTRQTKQNIVLAIAAALLVVSLSLTFGIH